MAGKVSVDMSLFKENVDHLRNAINSVDSEISTGETFEFTNVKPLTEDLENLIETIELLKTFRTLFNEDVDTLENVGESLQKQDETLAQSNMGAIDHRGNRPIQV